MRTALRALFPLVAVLGAGCAAPAALRVDEVAIGGASTRRVEVRELVQAPAAQRCVLRGDGEAERYDTPDFPIFASPNDAQPIAHVARYQTVHVAWSRFPAPNATGSRARAQVDLGGQSLIRIRGWSPLRDRRFFLRERADVSRDHVWVRGGHEVTLLGAEDGALVVEVPTELESPKTMRARTPCSNVVYTTETVPTTPADAAPTSRATFEMSGDTLHLFAAPDADPIAILVPNADSRPALHELERRQGAVHVGFEGAGIAFDAWVPEREVGGVMGYGSTGGSGWGRSRCGGSGRAKRAHAARNSDVWVGKNHPSGGPVAQIERGAEVFVMSTSGDRTGFALVGHEIVAHDDATFFVRTADLTMD